MNRRRNQQAALWLAEEIWPLVRREYPAAVLHIVGADPSPAIRALGRVAGVEVTGWVADLHAEYAKARVAVAPMQSEAGALNKIIDALAAGRPVVATTCANSGIGAPPEAIRLADSAQAFARAVVELLEDNQVWRCAAQAGRGYALSAFDWQAAASCLEAALVEMVR
jgi:glycosyltransferase involved in cell wall biosynthesis